MIARARLVELDLSDNAFGPIGMEGLVDLLKSPSCFTLQELKLNNTGCGVTGGKLLAKTLLECYHASRDVGHPLALRVFVLGRSRQENEGGKALAEVFKLMGSLEEVVMPQNGIYHEGLAALADAFSSNPNLRILNMNDNTFTEKGARPMAATLKKLKNLEVLNLGDCLLKSAGAKLIARAIKNNHPQLRELVLDSNEIRVSGGLEIVDSIADKKELVKISIDGNQFGDDGVQALRRRLKEIGQLDKLGEMEDNEEPDSDEDDPELEEEEEEDDVNENETTTTTTSEANFSFATPSSSKPVASIFSGSPKATGSIFGGTNSAATTTNNIFGGSPSSFAFQPSGNIFESKSTTDSPASSFKPSGNLFGGAAAAETPKGAAGSIFGTPASSSTPSSSIFGGGGGGGDAKPDSTTGIKPFSFGGTGSSIFSSSAATATPTPSLSLF